MVKSAAKIDIGSTSVVGVRYIVEIAVWVKNCDVLSNIFNASAFPSGDFAGSGGDKNKLEEFFSEFIIQFVKFDNVRRVRTTWLGPHVVSHMVVLGLMRKSRERLISLLKAGVLGRVSRSSKYTEILSFFPESKGA